MANTQSIWDEHEEILDPIIIISRMTKFKASSDPDRERYNWIQIADRCNRALGLPWPNQLAFEVIEVQTRMILINHFMFNKVDEWKEKLGEDEEKLKNAMASYNI